MYKFHITGFVGNGEHYWGNHPVDITVFAENEREAICKAEKVLGNRISITGRKIVIEEVEGDAECTS